MFFRPRPLIEHAAAAATSPAPLSADAALATALATPAALWTDADRDAVRLAHRHTAAQPRPAWVRELTDAQLTQGGRAGMAAAALTTAAVLAAGSLLPTGWPTAVFVLVSAPVALAVAGSLRHLATERRWRRLDGIMVSEGLLVVDRAELPPDDVVAPLVTAPSDVAVKFSARPAETPAGSEHPGVSVLRDDWQDEDLLAADPVFALAPADAIARARALRAGSIAGDVNASPVR